MRKVFVASNPSSGPANKVVVVYRDRRSRYASVSGQALKVPSRLCLDSNWEDTTGFLNEVRASLSKDLDKFTAADYKFPNRRARRSNPIKLHDYFDFSLLKYISLPVALVLASEFDRIRQISNLWKPFAVDLHTWDPAVRSLLNQIGFLELCGVDRNRGGVLEDDDSRVLKLRCGETTDGKAIGVYLQDIGIDLTREDPSLMEAIMEAVTNTVHHAYKNADLCVPHTVKSWWLVAALHKEDGDQRKLEVAVYDQGASIPRTLPSWDRYPFYVRKWKEFIETIGVLEDGASPDDARYDGDAIRLALEVGRSSTEEQFRGKGLNQIVSALDFCSAGTVVIYSRQGEFTLSKHSGLKSASRETPLTGTMVIWSLVL